MRLFVACKTLENQREKSEAFRFATLSLGKESLAFEMMAHWQTSERSWAASFRPQTVSKAKRIRNDMASKDYKLGSTRTKN